MGVVYIGDMWSKGAVMKIPLLIVGSLLLAIQSDDACADRFQIDGAFDGCEHGKLYALLGGGVLECREYNYFYQYMPEVITDGREVIIIGDERVAGYIHDGSVSETQINGEFEGCDFDRRYMLMNGFTFVCATYSYSYSYMPDVKIISISGRAPIVYIDGEKYDGTVY